MSKRSKDRQRVWWFSQDLVEFSLNYSSSAPLQGYTQEAHCRAKVNNFLKQNMNKKI